MDTLVVALRVALSLGVVLALLWVLQRRVAKGSLGKAARARRASSVTVVAKQGIGGKASVVVVDVEGQRLVLGVSESQVNVLAAAEAPAPVLELVADTAATTLAVTGPVPVVAPATVAGPAPVVTPSTTVTAASFGDALAAQLRSDRRPGGHRATAAHTADPEHTAQPTPIRPRTRAARGMRSTYVPTSQQLQGSILSADTWRQAAAAVRSRRVG